MSTIAHPTCPAVRKLHTLGVHVQCTQCLMSSCLRLLLHPLPLRSSLLTHVLHVLVHACRAFLPATALSLPWCCCCVLPGCPCSLQPSCPPRCCWQGCWRCGWCWRCCCQQAWWSCRMDVRGRSASYWSRWEAAGGKQAKGCCMLHVMCKIVYLKVACSSHASEAGKDQDFVFNMCSLVRCTHAYVMQLR